jgi:hypothetical protein
MSSPKKWLVVYTSQPGHLVDRAGECATKREYEHRLSADDGVGICKHFLWLRAVVFGSGGRHASDERKEEEEKRREPSGFDKSATAPC